MGVVVPTSISNIWEVESGILSYSQPFNEFHASVGCVKSSIKIINKIKKMCSMEKCGDI